MRRIGLMLAVAGLAAVPPRQQSGLDRVKWLVGCWEARSPTRLVTENWKAPQNGVMEELGQTFRRDTLLESESVRVFQRGPDLIYEAHPSNQAVAEFKASTATDSTVVFENPEHDFPKKVGYLLRGDSLRAFIEGPRGAQTRHIDFLYRRVACGK